MLELFHTIFMAPFWGRGFRPFFLLGALYSILSIGFWGMFYAGLYTPPAFIMLDPISWHAHEMIYGFSLAIVAGFLLTAVANWTGGAPVRQIHLAGLCCLWLSGRIVLNFDLGLPHFSVVMIAVSFIPALVVSLAIPLFKSWNKRNFIFLTLLSVLLVCDIWFLITSNIVALHVALMMILIMVSLIGGRIIPAFTVAALRRKGIETYQTDQLKLDMAALASLLAVALCLVFAKETLALTICAALSCIIHGLRMYHYHTLKTFDDPLLWILHAGYGWLVIGLGLLASTGLGLLTVPIVIHALTAGCIGSMILGMICRVTLGHTGRELKVGGLTTFSFFAIQLAALMRVFGPILTPEYMSEWVIGSALIWCLCFLAYLWIYTPMLFTSRPDGQAA
ncbi:MAG: NnrS family protein [Alphaproteobacteria bacterium]|nr:MAG: NnrS family protein [Alphaproteobacteria bacterium]